MTGLKSMFEAALAHDPTFKSHDKSAQETLTFLLNENPDIQKLLTAGLTPTQILEGATYANNVPMISAALSSNATVTDTVTRNARFGPALLPAYKVLVEKGKLDINTHFSYFGTPLGKALLHNDLDFTAFLLTSGASPNEHCFASSTPLELCIKRRAGPPIIDLLVKSGAQFPIPGLIFTAIINCNSEIIPYLVQKGQDPNERVEDCESIDEDDGRWTPLHFTAKRGDTDSVKILLESGADVDLQDSNEMTPLQLAEEWGRDDVVEILRARKKAS